MAYDTAIVRNFVEKMTNQREVPRRISQILHGEEKCWDPTWKLPHFSEGVTVKQFIEALLVHSEFVLSTKPSNSSNQTDFERALGEGEVRFTHFVKFKDDTCMSQKMWKIMWLRGAAIVGHDSLPGVDCIVPVRLPDGRFTALFFQWKARALKVSKVHLIYDLDTIPGCFDPNQEAQGQVPYATFGVQLGLQAASSTAPVEIVVHSHKARKGKSSATKQSGNTQEIVSRKPVSSTGAALGPIREPSRIAAKNTPRHVRYSFFIDGCSHTQFNVIANEQEKTQYATALNHRDFLAEHPRSGNPTSLSYIRRMKPFWSVSPDAHQWHGIDLSDIREGSGPKVPAVVVEREEDDSEVPKALSHLVQVEIMDIAE
ncbi:hypothetical protein K474DRAFT_1669947 [Panus rudis PR-1116 ss-1]|nr:hypothetical protein K474DRAFT_1669947 [Panus rudis PR-1116 ss-1]